MKTPLDEFIGSYFDYKELNQSSDSFVHEKTGLEFVRVPAGEFIYSYVGEKVRIEKKRYMDGPLLEYKTEYGEKKIRLPEFWMSKTPVTNAVYNRFMPDWKYDANKKEHPVVKVSWYDAIAFCSWAGLELPTEEQWEKAARGMDGRAYPWGNNDPTDKLCNFGVNMSGTTAVGDYSPEGDSPYGCVDMSGNVWEWCLNKYDTPEDVKVDKDEAWRVLRGGSWANNPDYAGATFRDCDDPDSTANYLGFRVLAVRRPLY